jgi:hypothetical protein
MFLLAVPFAAATFAVERLFTTHSPFIFFLQVIGTFPVFLLAVVLGFRTYIRQKLAPILRTTLFA